MRTQKTDQCELGLKQLLYFVQLARCPVGGPSSLENAKTRLFRTKIVSKFEMIHSNLRLIIPFFSNS